MWWRWGGWGVGVTSTLQAYSPRTAVVITL